MYKLVNTFMCIVSLFNIAQCTRAHTHAHADATEALNSAIVTNIMNEYGEMGYISPDNFKSFLERALASDRHMEHPLVVVEESDAHMLTVLQACTDVTNITACQKFLSEHVSN